MPSALQYIRADDASRWQEYDSDMERRHRAEVFETNEKYYDGEHFKPLMVTEEDPVDDNVVINITKQAIDRTLSFVFPDMPRMVLDADENVTPEEEYLDATFRYNGGSVFLTSVAYNGALSGHCFVRIIRPDPLDEDGGRYPQLVNIHPKNIVAYWNAENMREVLWYELRWASGKSYYLQDIVFRKELRQWHTYTYVQEKGTSHWTLVGDQPQIWDSPLGPIVHWQHLPNVNAFYGTPEATKDQIRLNDAVNRVASDVSRIIRYHAAPRTIGVGLSAEEINETAIDGFFTVDNPDANIYNLEMKSDLGSSMNFLDILIHNHLQQSRVVIMRGTVKDFQRVTNTAIRAVFLDMIAKNQILRWNYGDALQRIAQRILMIGGYGANRRPNILWSDPLPSDDTELVNAIAIERNLKLVSQETASKLRGYDWNSEKERMEREAELVFNQNKESTGAAPIKQDVNEVRR